MLSFISVTDRGVVRKQEVRKGEKNREQQHVTENKGRKMHQT